MYIQIAYASSGVAMAEVQRQTQILVITFSVDIVAGRSGRPPARSESVKTCSFEQYLRPLRGIEKQNDPQNEAFDSPVKVIFVHQQNPLQSGNFCRSSL